uniref:Uncharacterized protein n=1 Tax=Rhizophagus irregularis (strain DAOM 181602 / DAOM 197198 / MUCL 43194) TaxID=747089 RepID=U9SVS6_RHIID
MTEEPLFTHNTSEDDTQPVNIDGALKFNEETVPIPPIAAAIVSESIWVERTKQSWVLDPNDSSDFKINCPWCKKKYKFHGRIIGTLVDLNDDSFSEALATNNSCLLLFTTTSFHIRNLTDSESKNWNQCKWKTYYRKLNFQIIELKRARQFRITWKNIVRRAVFVYAGIPFPFSIDLISAVQRQRDFTEKMVNNEWINCMEVQ